MKTWILGIFLVLVGLILVIGLWLLGYHLSGKWAFNQWRAERIAMGDRLAWKDLVPPAVPVEQNFAQASLIRGAIVSKDQVDDRFKALSLKEEAIKGLGNWQEGRRDDLSVIAQAYGKADVGSVLGPFESTLKELDEASRRSGNRFPIDYEEGQMPAIVGFRGAIRTLRIRAQSRLREGHSDQALEDIQTCLRIAGHLRTEPNFISALLRKAILGISLQAVWEGLEDHRWSSQQLMLIQSELTRIDLLATSKLAWQAERLSAIDSWSATAENRPPPKYWDSPNERQVKFGKLGRGWFYRNLLVFCQFESSMVDAQDPSAHRVYPERLIDPLLWLKRMRFRKDLIMAQIAIPALTEQVIRFANLQALIDEGVVVCALERYRLDKGQYPMHLKDLAPGYLQALPHDLVTGSPLYYARSGHSFTLYEVGWDGKDDGGVLNWIGEGKDRKIDPFRGDWVWPHAKP